MGIRIQSKSSPNPSEFFEIICDEKAGFLLLLGVPFEVVRDSKSENKFIAQFKSMIRKLRGSEKGWKRFPTDNKERIVNYCKRERLRGKSWNAIACKVDKSPNATLEPKELKRLINKYHSGNIYLGPTGQKIELKVGPITKVKGEKWEIIELPKGKVSAIVGLNKLKGDVDLFDNMISKLQAENKDKDKKEILKAVSEEIKGLEGYERILAIYIQFLSRIKNDSTFFKKLFQ